MKIRNRSTTTPTSGESSKAVESFAHDDSSLEQKVSFSNKVKELALHPKTPIWVGGLFVVVLLGFGAYKLEPKISGRPNIVSFDPVKFMNSQRAAASVLITAQGSPDVSLALTQVAKQAQQVIKEKANGATVLIKQALVLPDDVYDITDSVLQHFGLPTNVPTVTVGPEAYVKLEDIAPSDAAFSGGKLREDYRLELDKKSEQLAKDAAKNSAQKNAVP